MKASDFQQYIGGTDDFMKRVTKDTKGCVQLSSNDTFSDNIWFKGEKTAEEENTEVVDYCGPVKTSHKVFCLSTLEKPTNEWPVGYHIVMESDMRVPGDIPLMDIVYKYKYQKVLGFISME